MSVEKIINKKCKEKIVMLTAYDFITASILEKCGVDIILVGDSLGTVVMGYNSTVPVTIEDMVRHTKAVRNGAKDSLIVSDMPFLSYGASISESVTNAGRLLKEGGANAVKLEGGAVMADTIRAIINVGIPVMGHIGLKPQSVNKNGYKIEGKDENSEIRLVHEAKAIEEAGAFAIVLEGVTEEAAKYVTDTVKIPTIGIGAGRFTDGQVLVITDMLGMQEGLNLKHNKRFAEIGNIIKEAVTEYAKEVRNLEFPAEAQIFHKEAQK